MENKRFILTDCYFNNMTCFYLYDDEGKRMKTVGETLMFSEEELYDKCMPYEKKYCKKYIEWVKKLGLSFNE